MAEDTFLDFYEIVDITKVEGIVVTNSPTHLLKYICILPCVFFEFRKTLLILVRVPISGVSREAAVVYRYIKKYFF